MKMERIIGWGHPDLIWELSHGPAHLFFDGTFKVVPRGFKQLFVMMAYVTSCDLNVNILNKQYSNTKQPFAIETGSQKTQGPIRPTDP